MNFFLELMFRMLGLRRARVLHLPPDASLLSSYKRRWFDSDPFPCNIPHCNIPCAMSPRGPLQYPNCNIPIALLHDKMGSSTAPLPQCRTPIALSPYCLRQLLTFMCLRSYFRIKSLHSAAAVLSRYQATRSPLALISRKSHCIRPGAHRLRTRAGSIPTGHRLRARGLQEAAASEPADPGAGPCPRPWPVIFWSLPKRGFHHRLEPGSGPRLPMPPALNSGTRQKLQLDLT